MTQSGLKRKSQTRPLFLLFCDNTTPATMASPSTSFESYLSSSLGDDECVAKHEESNVQNRTVHYCEKLSCNEYPNDCMNWQLRNVSDLSCSGQGGSCACMNVQDIQTGGTISCEGPIACSDSSFEGDGSFTMFCDDGACEATSVSGVDTLICGHVGCNSV